MNLRISRNAIRHAEHLAEIRNIALQLWQRNIDLAREVEHLQEAKEVLAEVERLRAEVKDLADKVDGWVPGNCPTFAGFFGY